MKFFFFNFFCSSEVQYEEDLARLFISEEPSERPVTDGEPALPKIRTMICEKGMYFLCANQAKRCISHEICT